MMIKRIQWLGLSAFAIGIMLHSASAMASRMGSSRIPQLQTRKTSVVPAIALDSNDSVRRKQSLPSKFSRTTIISPLFSTSAAAVGSMASVATPLKQSLLAFRGGSTFALTRVTKSILDDVAASKTKSWIVLVLAILLETCGSTLSKRARDTSNPSLFLVAVSLNLLSICGFCTCLAKLDVGVAYAIWAALGTVIVTAAGILFFQEACDPIKLISILLIIVGVVGLNLGDSH